MYSSNAATRLEDFSLPLTTNAQLVEPNGDAPPQFITPFAELEVVADFGTSNIPVRLVTPILSSDVNRLLKRNAKPAQ